MIRKSDWINRAVQAEATTASAKARAEAAEWLIKRLLTEIGEKNARIGELEDSLRARSLAELRAVRPVAMPQYPYDADDDEEWGFDPTGLFRFKLPPLTPEEQRVADELRSSL